MRLVRELGKETPYQMGLRLLRLLVWMPLLIALLTKTHAQTLHYGKQIVLRLAPSPTNPRNSEGDFIRLRDGRILFIYTHFSGGAGDDDSAYLAARESRDGGVTWSDSDVVVVPNEGRQNVMSVSLLRLPDGRIALFYLRKNSPGDCRPVVRFSSDEARTWGPAREMVHEPGYYVMNNDRVVRLRSGRLVAPVALHKTPDTPWSNAAKTFCYLSDDGGRTWHRSGAVANPEGVTLQEPGVVELKDGSLLLFCRTNAGTQFISRSTDGGEHWEPARPSNIVSPMSPASMERIPATGDLLLVWNNTPGPLRTPLNVAISRDDGTTWEKVKTLERDPFGWYCYSAIEFIGNHVLLAYCAGNRRKESGLATTQLTRLNLDWLYADPTPAPHVVRDSAGVVTLGCDLRGAEIYYRLGSWASSLSKYTAPLHLKHTCRLWMEAAYPGRPPSDLVQAIVGRDVLSSSLQPPCRRTLPGLNYLYFEGNFPRTDSLLRATPAARGSADGVTLGVRRRDQYFGLLFRGYLVAPADGLYGFALVSNDGSALLVDGAPVVNNDGPHASTRVEGWIGLKKGLHRFEVRYFQQGGTRELQVLWRPPAGRWESVPAQAFRRCR